MSNRLLALAWPLRINPTAKAVLIALADTERDDGRPNYPSIARLCEMTCFSNRAVIDAIDYLVGKKLLAADRKAGRQTRYRLRLEPVSEVHNQDDSELSTTSEGGSQLPVSEAHNSLSTTSEPAASQPVNVAHEPVNVAPKPVSQVHTTHNPITHKDPESAGAQPTVDSSESPSLSKPDEGKAEEQDLPTGFLRKAMEIRTANHPRGALSESQICEAFRKFEISKPGNRSLSDWGMWVDREDRAKTPQVAAAGTTPPPGTLNAAVQAPVDDVTPPPLDPGQLEAKKELERVATVTGLSVKEAALQASRRVLGLPEREAA